MADMKKDFSAKIITFPEVYDISYDLANQVTNSSASFDIIIAIARGGVTPARLLCDFLNIDHLTSLQVRHYTSGAEELDKAEIIDPVDVEIKGKNVLLVDDVNDSGKTMRAAADHVQTLDPALLKSAVLHEKKTTSFNTDFTGKILEKWEWLIYQWAATEDILGFLYRDKMIDASERKIIAHFNEKYNLEIDKELFRKVMGIRKNYI